MKSCKAPGPSGVISDRLKAAGDASSKWVADVCNAVVKELKIPKDWRNIWMVNVFKGKGDGLKCGSYRSIILLEHVMKIFERVLENRMR